jgi:hypothetical protein
MLMDIRHAKLPTAFGFCIWILLFWHIVATRGHSYFSHETTNLPFFSLLQNRGAGHIYKPVYNPVPWLVLFHWLHGD